MSSAPSSTLGAVWLQKNIIIVYVRVCVLGGGQGYILVLIRGYILPVQGEHHRLGISRWVETNCMTNLMERRHQEEIATVPPLSSIKMNLSAQLWGPCMAQPTVVPGPGALGSIKRLSISMTTFLKPDFNVYIASVPLGEGNISSILPDVEGFPQDDVHFLLGDVWGVLGHPVAHPPRAPLRSFKCKALPSLLPRSCVSLPLHLWQCRGTLLV